MAPALAIAHQDAAKQRALEAFLRHGTVALACEAAHVGRSTWYEWLAKDPSFAALVDEAAEHVTDALEGEAMRRASLAKGGSDTLLIFLLKARRRAKYADKEVITLLHADVQRRLEQQVRLMASKPTWESEELLEACSNIWK